MAGILVVVLMLLGMLTSTVSAKPSTDLFLAARNAPAEAYQLSTEHMQQIQGGLTVWQAVGIGLIVAGGAVAVVGLIGVVGIVSGLTLAAEAGTAGALFLGGVSAATTGSAICDIVGCS